ncbi:hypothetical protein [Saccharopolyspora sp. ASAGF58]|uniref:hypothetical protein n=1 Tax=Saccharopolyspora sp. ASAGF58 TaxID=2719023 RepID=UPI00143FCA4A|nr:hypothetical protein [Saccharopolyspora sp. ASAGF58]QIZ35330.1 hypothetical protein FDZ84_12200 [Saccharopolyspora sp. ASAGF58]
MTASTWTWVDWTGVRQYRTDANTRCGRVIALPDAGTAIAGDCWPCWPPEHLVFQPKPSDQNL